MAYKGFWIYFLEAQLTILHLDFRGGEGPLAMVVCCASGISVGLKNKGLQNLFTSVWRNLPDAWLC